MSRRSWKLSKLLPRLLKRRKRLRSSNVSKRKRPLNLNARKRKKLPNSSVLKMKLLNSRKRRMKKLWPRKSRKNRRKEPPLKQKARVQPTRRLRTRPSRMLAPQSNPANPPSRKRKTRRRARSELDGGPPKTLLYPTQYITHIYEN